MSGRDKAKRRRKRRLAGAAVQQAPAPEPPKKKADVVREQLVPLEEGERPLAVTIAAIVAGILVIAYLVAFAIGSGNIAAGAPFVVVLAIAAVGMWRGRYWAVLGFQVLLALTLVNGMLFLLIRASDPLAIAGGLVITAAAGALFWFLVRALARLQMPERRPPSADG
jgi:lysozyme family protein